MTLKCTVALAGSLVLFQTTVRAQEFEGVMEQRSFEVAPDVLELVLGDAMWGPDEISTARAAFDVPVERYLEFEGQGVEVTDLKLYFKSGRLRSEFLSQGRLVGFQIMDMTSGTLRMANADSRTYFEWTSEDVAKIRASIQESLQEAGVDPEWAAQVQAQLMGEVTETGRSATINGMEVQAIEILGDESVTQGWYADDAFGVSAIVMKLGEYANAQYGGDPEADPSDVVWERGIPVLIQTFQLYESELSVEEITSVSRESVPDEMFAIPSDYELTPNPFADLIGE
jgi:hypothetical protein